MAKAKHNVVEIVEQSDDQVTYEANIEAEIAAVQASLEAEKGDKQALQNNKQYLQTFGYEMAEQMEDADSVAANTKRNILLNAASTYSQKEQVDAILDGFAQYHKEQGANERQISVRRSEAKAVFDAVAKTEISGANLAELENVTGGYHAFIDTARRLRDAGKVITTPKAPRARTITPKQVEHIGETMQSGSPEQLTSIAQMALREIHLQVPPNTAETPKKAELAGKQTLLVIQAAAVALGNNRSADAFFHNVASEVLAIVSKALEQLQKAEQGAADVAQMAEGEKLAA